MSTTLHIPLIVGTNRQGSKSSWVAQAIASAAAERDDIVVTVFDLHTMQFPSDDYVPDMETMFPEYYAAMTAADGYIIVMPEYNHSFPGVLKTALDSLLSEYIHKPVAVAGVSSGMSGGMRAVQSFLPVARELGLSMTFTDLYFPNVGDTFTAEGNLKDPEKFAPRAEKFFDELVWMARTLQWGRNNVPQP